MSSDDSSVLSGSKIRQFGLYRTIDARTEEFLRLSRKRQIRQGCACAAVSTAITVTVVIVIFFVYEFSMNSETNLENSMKSNWLSLMNDTSGDSSFDSKLTKANIDRTTLKFLPLLIKAIKKNVLLEKFLEDHSSSSPAYDKKESKETTGDSFEPNTFSNQWFKMPTTKLYAIEYKTSPVVYYRSPTKNVEYYTKIRKIRDYQRVINYVDKMISEKVYIRSTRPMLKGETHTEKPFVKKISIFKKTTLKPTLHKTLMSPKNNTEPKLHCKCPKNLGILLNKILLSVQKLLPETNGQDKKLLDCVKNETNQITTNPTPTKSNLINILSRFSTFEPLMATSTEKTTSGIVSQEARTFAFETELVTEAYNYYTNSINSSPKAKSYDQTTIIRENYKESNKRQNIIQTTTQRIMFINKYKNIIHRKQLLRNSEINFTKAISESIFGGIEYDDYSYITPTTKNNDAIYNDTINFIETKLNYLNHIDSNAKNLKNKTKKPMYKKIKKPTLQSRKSTKLDFNIIDNKIALVKPKPIYTNKTNNKTTQNYTKNTNMQLNNIVTNTPTALTTMNKFPEDKIALDLPNSNPMKSNKVPDEIIINFNMSDLPILHEETNFVTPKTSYYDYSRYPKPNKTTYRFIKNEKKSSMSNTLLKTRKSKSNSNTTLYIINTTNHLPRENSNYSKLNESISLLNRDNNNLKSKLNNTLTVLKQLQKDNEKLYVNNETTSVTTEVYKEKQSTDVFEEDVEFLTGEFSDITRQPENIGDKPENNSIIKKDSFDLTWEDLTNEYIPAWKSMIPEPKPLYLEYHKINEKQEDRQEEDYNINSMFYDLNI